MNRYGRGGKMKKTFSFLMLMAVTLIFAGCMPNDAYGSLYQQIDGLKTEIEQIDAQNEETLLENDSLSAEIDKLEEEKKALFDQAEELKRISRIRAGEARKYEDKGFGILPEQLDFYILNLIVTQTKYQNLAYNGYMEKIYDFSHPLNYYYLYDDGSDSDKYIYINYEMSFDGNFISKVYFFYWEEDSSFKESEEFEKYMTLISEALIMALDGNAEYSEDIETRAQSLIKNKKDYGYECLFTNSKMGDEKTFTILAKD